MTNLSGVRFSFGLCLFPTEGVVMEEEGSIFFFFNSMPPFLTQNLFHR